MFLKLFRKVASNIKEIHEMALFGIMSNEDIYFVFNGSPLFYVMLPILGFLITLQAVLKSYELYKAHNKNFDRWFGFIVSALCATLASVSLYGAVAAAYFELNFALGPWFFLASVGVAFTHQLTMMGLNLYRVFESPLHSSQHKHYLQAALNNLFHLALLAAVIGTVVFVMLTPVAPAVGAAFALASVAFTAASILWRIIPRDWKLSIKNVLGLGKPTEEELHKEPKPESTPSEQLENKEEKHCKSIFIKSEHSAVVKSIPCHDGLYYLQGIIKQKISVFNHNPLPHSDKNKQKKALLKELLTSFNGDMNCSKKDLLKRYPLAFQSFWAEKGDVEQIVDAALVLRKKYQEKNALQLEDTPTVAGLK